MKGNMHIIAMSLIGILLASGFADYYNYGAAVNFETLAQGAGGPSEIGEHVILNETEWNRFFAGQNIKMPDFSKEMAIAVFMGQLTHGGSSIEITDIEETDAGITVFVKTTMPKGMVTNAITSPFHVVKLAKNDTPVFFNHGGNDGFIYGTAPVTSVEISVDALALQSFPTQIRIVANIVVHGYLPDGCTEIDQVTQKRDENTFTMKITTKRLKDAYCTQSIMPFDKTVPLDLYGLPDGNYTVNVNGVIAKFEMPAGMQPRAGGIQSIRSNH